MANKYLPLRERFFAKTEKGPDCWVWKGSAHVTRGHLRGQISVNGRLTMASRASWILHWGEIPAGMFVLHRCDRPICVNPDHLFLGTQSDNMRDCAAKGRLYKGGPKIRTRCRRGHPLSGENLVSGFYGGYAHRQCRTCSNDRRREREARKKARLAALDAEGDGNGPSTK